LLKKKISYKAKKKMGTDASDDKIQRKPEGKKGTQEPQAFITGFSLQI